MNFIISKGNPKKASHGPTVLDTVSLPDVTSNSEEYLKCRGGGGGMRKTYIEDFYDYT